MSTGTQLRNLRHVGRCVAAVWRRRRPRLGTAAQGPALDTPNTKDRHGDDGQDGTDRR